MKKQTDEYYNEADINVLRQTLIDYDEESEISEYSYSDIDTNYSIRAISSDPNVVRIEKLDNNSFRIKAVQKTSSTKKLLHNIYC